MIKSHSFHIPIMGIGFTLDTPLNVAHYGIDSAISLSDDMLMERMRMFYCEKFKLPYTEITDKINDFRARRITSYLNLIDTLVKKNFQKLKNSKLEENTEVKKYVDMLPDSSTIKQKIKDLSGTYCEVKKLRSWITDHLSMGSIDVNIMTKVDKANYSKGKKLAIEYNDAHAALRGYANSNLNSSLIFSAGMNPKLFGYLEQFEDFYPNEEGKIKKKVILKVSDYRSALIQGKFLAKKGIHVSEYRIESGLNCGGHAFATDGYLMGPILEEFKDKREELIQATREILLQALTSKNLPVPKVTLPLKITAQGGVGSAEEHNFLLNHYQMDSIGWGSPFLLVPEVTTVDDITLNKLINAKEDDIYLSHISPLGIPFNNLRGNTKDMEKQNFIEKSRPGSSCPKKFLALNTEFKKTGLCTASREYQYLKLNELQEKNLSATAYQQAYDKLVEKACICVGLGTSALLKNKMSTRSEGEGVSICPGPNIAYFCETMSLRKIVSFIYGSTESLTNANRPNMFLKELDLYITFLKNKIDESKIAMTHKQESYLLTFAKNIADGIQYYYNLFKDIEGTFQDIRPKMILELEKSKADLQLLIKSI